MTKALMVVFGKLKKIELTAVLAWAVVFTLGAFTFFLIWQAAQNPTIPYGFEFSEYAPAKSPVCVGEPVQIENVRFTVDVPDREFVTVRWNTTFQKLWEDGSVGEIAVNSWGLHGSQSESVWVYNQSFQETFPIVAIQQPEGGLSVGYWSYSGAGNYGGNQERGYTVKFWVKECDFDG